MKRRWLICGIFIALLTLSVGGWVFSALYFCFVQFQYGSREIGAGTTRGTVGFYFRHYGTTAENHLNYDYFCFRQPDIRFWPTSYKKSARDFRFFGFGYSHGDRFSFNARVPTWSFALPFWF
ncbi:MAG: hypothetical protein FWD53_00340, partial [Phycisphaerales bacterium]|nr:hypothetical protein [Phycisphaerales bacterium]